MAQKLPHRRDILIAYDRHGDPVEVPAGRMTTVVSEMPKCDLCARHGIDRVADYDARMHDGRWAHLCESHWYRATSRKLGTGHGQMLIPTKGDA